MAHEAPTYTDRIVPDPTSMTGTPIVKGTEIAVATLLAKLAGTPDVDAVLREYPRLTPDDIKAVLEYAEAEHLGASAPETRGFISPQGFYQAAIQREDIRRILDALAK